MFNGKKIAVILPAYNAARTLEKTVADIPREIVDDIILVDDCSHDETVKIAEKINLYYVVHDKNLGYGGNQKTCYKEALERGADIVVMLHPDYQYDPRLIPALIALVAYGDYDMSIASRILNGKCIKNGMPLYKYIANRFLTLIQNIVIREKFSEYHSGYRAFSAPLLRALPLERNSNNFIFDNQMFLQALYYDYKVGEISCSTRYEKESSSINFWRSCRYGLGVIKESFRYTLAKHGRVKSDLFSALKR